MTTMNPFLVQSTLPYLAPHFDQIANHHYRPAFDEGMQQKRAEIAAIALNPQTPDFNNTISAGVIPAIIFINVDLPAPLPPSRAWTSP